MSKELIHYRRLERRLWMRRWREGGEESVGEETILDEMETACIDLTESEQAMLRAEGPRCWPADSSALPPQFADARYVSGAGAWPYEGFLSPVEAILSKEAA